jgi:hypothetical protein
MFYIHVLKHPPQQEPDPGMPPSTLELESQPMLRQHQQQLRKRCQRTRETYALERRLFT